MMWLGRERKGRNLRKLRRIRGVFHVEHPLWEG